jgi:hypothetical protein
VRKAQLYVLAQTFFGISDAMWLRDKPENLIIVLQNEWGHSGKHYLSKS